MSTSKYLCEHSHWISSPGILKSSFIISRQNCQVATNVHASSANREEEGCCLMKFNLPNEGTGRTTYDVNSQLGGMCTDD